MIWTYRCPRCGAHYVIAASFEPEYRIIHSHTLKLGVVDGVAAVLTNHVRARLCSIYITREKILIQVLP